MSGVAASTVRANILRYHRNGNRFKPRTGQGRKSLIPLHIQQQIVSQEMLTAMRFLPIRERARRHSVDMNIRLSLYQLKLIYKRHKVRFRQPKVSARLPDGKEMELVPERILFAERMKRLLDDGRVVVYLDEATF